MTARSDGRSPGCTRVDRGEAVVQHVLLVPVVLTLLLLGVQAALTFHAANVASSAAAQGAAAGAARHGTADRAQAIASSTVLELGGRAGARPTVLVSATDVVVTVQVRVPHVVPFFPAVVRRTAREPRERFVPETQR